MEVVNKYRVDISSWKRREHYNFFRTFDQPFFGITKRINCTEAYRYCKSYNIPFLSYYLHKSLSAANHITEFRYRIEDEQVVEYGRIAGSITVMRRDETFGFAYFNYYPDFRTFTEEATAQIRSEKIASGLNLRPHTNDLIHFSILPEIEFSSMQHAQMLKGNDSVPKIVFGQLIFNEGKVLLPVAVHVHHALCDGLHVSKFFKEYEKLLRVSS